jgi:hypothetical protein
MNTLGTLWLLVVLTSGGDLKVIQVYPHLHECTARLGKSAADSDRICMSAFASCQAEGARTA